MAASARQSLFVTNRGTTIKRTAIVCFIAAIVMMVVSNMTSGNADESTSGEDETTLGAPQSAPSEVPDVAAALADPFEPYEGVNDASGEVDEDEDAFASDAEETAEPENTSEYTALLTVAQDVATAYGTYTYEMSPDEYVESIPSLDAAYRKELLSVAEQNWPEIKQVEGTSESTLTGTTPDIVYYRDTTGRAEISVSVIQKIGLASGDRERTQSFVVSLRRVDASGAEAWRVTSIAS